MTIKQFKKNTFLVNDLVEEQYVINDSNQNEIISEEVIDKTISTDLTNNTNANEQKTKKLSPYNIFVTKTTNELKLKYPNMLPKDRKVELSRLWKLEKEKL